MKKILISIPHSLYPISHGAIVRVIEEAKFLSKNGFDVHLIGNRTKIPNYSVTSLIMGIKIMRKPKSEEFIEQVLKHQLVLDVGGKPVEYGLGSQKVQNHT